MEFLTSRGFTAAAFVGNALEEAAVAGAVAGTVARFGHVDVIVNMAGKVHWSSVLDMELAEWREAVLSFPTAGMLTTKHGARAMIAGGRKGSIIHLLSTAAHFGEASGAAYTAAKAALLNLARSAAMDLAHEGIRVNTITPCAMEHQLWTNMREEIFDKNFVPPQRRSFYSRDDYLKMIPLERFPRASDLAWAAVFLAADEFELPDRRRYPGRRRVAVQVSDLAAGRPYRREHQRLRTQHRSHAIRRRQRQADRMTGCVGWVEHFARPNASTTLAGSVGSRARALDPTYEDRGGGT